MEKTTKKSWLTQYEENYNGKSLEAMSLQPYLKKNFKGNVYIPWAVMERLTYMQDPDAKFIKSPTIISNEMSIKTTIKGEYTEVQNYAHFVYVTLTFLGKEFDELYPIQDNAYNAPKTYDQNMVNKAYQRAIAKVASRATGLGLKLYENLELQFDEPTEPVVPLVVTPVPTIAPLTPKMTEPSAPQSALKTPVSRKKATVDEPAPVLDPTATASGQAIEEPKQAIEEPRAVPVMTSDDPVEQIIAILHNPEYEAKLNAILRSFNPSFIKQFGYSISLLDSHDELQKKLSQLPDPVKFLASIERVTQ